MAVRGDFPWPRLGIFNGRLRGDSDGRYHPRASNPERSKRRPTATTCDACVSASPRRRAFAAAVSRRTGAGRWMGPEGSPGTLVVGQFTDPEGNLIGVAGTE